MSEYFDFHIYSNICFAPHSFTLVPNMKMKDKVSQNDESSMTTDKTFGPIYNIVNMKYLYGLSFSSPFLYDFIVVRSCLQTFLFSKFTSTHRGHFIQIQGR